MARLTSLKRALIGDPRASGELTGQVLPPWLALPTFASDTLSSAAYATEETMVVLALAGAGALSTVTPLAGIVAVVMLVVVVGYQQTVRAYPDGGGAYVVASRNLGANAGLVAAAALLIDYVLTVAVSVSAGTSAIVSTFPELAPGRLVIALSFLAVVTVTNLRGVREASLVVALPVYTFVTIMAAMILRGIVLCTTASCPAVPFDQPPVPEATTGLTVLLVLRALATSATSLTGVEAVSNGVTAFRAPASRNASRTLGAIGLIAAPMLLGIGWLASRIEGVVAFGGLERTVTSQIAGAVFGPTGIGFYLVQVATAAILFLAANTAYADFPRLASRLAEDRWLPRQLAVRGDRLVFSNGILLLSVAAALLVALAGARVTLLVALYIVGVFTAFSLSQLGMVRHWLRERPEGWRRSMAINGVGATATSAILLVVLVTKFGVGAWVVLIIGPLLVAAMKGVRAHYDAYEEAIRQSSLEVQPRRAVRMVVLEDRVDAATASSVAYGYGVGAAEVTGVLIPTSRRRANLRERWRQMAPDLEVREQPTGLRATPSAAMRDAALALADEHPEDFTVAVVPETRSETWLEIARRHRVAQRAKAVLVADGRLVVANVVAPIGGPGPYQVTEPVQHHVVVLVNRVHEAALRAVAYAQSLQATSVQALSVNVGGQRSREILGAWTRAGLDIPLDLVDSPYRSMVDSVQDYIEDFEPDGQHTVVTVVMAEFVLRRWWLRSLHNQTVLQIKSSLLFTRGVVTTSVPTLMPHLRRGRGAVGGPRPTEDPQPQPA